MSDEHAKDSTKIKQFWTLLFFNENTDVIEELDEQIWLRTRMYMYTTAVLVAVWGVFDFFIDLSNLWIFLSLRGVYTPLTLLCAFFFHLLVFRQRHKRWALVHYLLLILDIGAMVLWTEHFVKYLIGFSTIFWGASVIMLWRFWYTVVPGVAVIVIAFLRFYFLPHNVPLGELITGLYYFTTCLVFASIISAYGYRNAYLLSEKNITLEKAQDMLVQAEKMTSMNLLVASVAHEINTPVGTALTAVSHAEEQIAQLLSVLKLGEVTIDQLENPAKDGMASLKSAFRELNRTSKLVEKFKGVAVDQSTFEKRKFNLPEYLLEDIIQASMHPILKQSNIIVEVGGEQDFVIDSYPGEYSQIFTNLMINSITHGFCGGRPRENKGRIDIAFSLNGTESLSIFYQDYGQGMSAHVLSKIFDPFFTTKGTEQSSEGRGHKGSGLGMTIVYNIVTQKLGGKIEAFSQVGEGTQFTIVVPI